MILPQSCHTPPISWKNGKTVVESNARPKTLLGLLQRAASLWPNHGVSFKENGWDQEANFMTYKEILREAEVVLPRPWTNVNSANNG
jgi:hypothetical protein